ncbi:hypothetical protein BEH94_10265 [Candidatus Altiarchaeales archaeon WOR_SM1_SCG]|nr:hypothetical protein BEH94_10265 [Candidatus Altiarchaeales archaeon WOR_SM1_SCG]
MANKLTGRDAGKILAWLYYIREEYSSVDSSIALRKKLKLNRSRTNNALNKLYNERLIDAIPPETPRSNWKDIRLTNPGFDILENKDNYKRHFGVELNLGIFKLKWGAEER